MNIGPGGNQAINFATQDHPYSKCGVQPNFTPRNPIEGIPLSLRLNPEDGAMIQVRVRAEKNTIAVKQIDLFDTKKSKFAKQERVALASNSCAGISLVGKGRIVKLSSTPNLA